MKSLIIKKKKEDMIYFKNWRDKIFDLLLEKNFMACSLWLLIIIIFFVSGILLSGLFLMLLWNWLAPLFWPEAPILGYWQAVGIGVLLSILGGFFKSTRVSSK